VKVLVLAGGDSNERQVSLTSGAAVFEALERLGHEVLVMDPSTGQSLLGPDGKYALEADKNSDSRLVTVDRKTLANSLVRFDYHDVDVVFIALHGGAGENGTIQNLLDLAGVAYTGSGMAASAVSMDKAMGKRLMKSVDVPTPTWALCQLDSEEDIPQITAHIASRFKPPLIIKPNDGGSTIGLTKVYDVEQIPRALKAALEHSHAVLVEEFIPGREVTVAVFDGEAYPVVEIRPKNGLYDYEAKYTKGMSEYLAPAPIEEAVAEQLQKSAVRVYEAMGAEGLARVDFILRDDGRFYCLELNSLPGMTALSLAPMAMKVKGISYEQLVQMQLESALKRKK
jgi:D-alanine-D-alanine ligase